MKVDAAQTMMPSPDDEINKVMRAGALFLLDSQDEFQMVNASSGFFL